MDMRNEHNSIPVAMPNQNETGAAQIEADASGPGFFRSLPRSARFRLDRRSRTTLAGSGI